MKEANSATNTWAARARLRLPSSLAMIVANVCEIALPLARGIGLAHFLSPEQFGIALTITVTAGIIELITDLGTGQLALRLDKDESLDTLHSVSLIRGVMLGIVIVASGPLFGRLFHTEGAAWVYAIVGLSSAIRGFQHLEVAADMREYRYVGEALTLISGQTAWTLVSLVAATMLHDYRAMAYGLLAGVIANIFISHIVTTRPWRLGWHRPTLAEAMKYGGPLALNGMASAVTSLGDRTLTGATISLAQLAQYTALATGAFLPRSAVLKYLNYVFTPHFINADGPEGRRRVACVWLVIVSTISGIFGIGYFALGQAATMLVFGHAYDPPQTIVSLIALLGTVRYMAGLSAPPALATGHNGILAGATLLSTSGLALGALFLLWGPSLDRLVLGLTIGESATLLWVTSRVCQIVHLKRAHGFFGVFAPIIVITGLAALTYSFQNESFGTRTAIFAVGGLIQLCVLFATARLSQIHIAEMFTYLFPRHKHRAAAGKSGRQH